MPTPIDHRITLAGIREASKTINPVFLHTPQFVSEPLSARLDCELTVKIETLNPIRSFKGRGADYLLRKAHDRGDARRLVCASAGNWGQAMAYVCRERQQPIDIFAADAVNELKAERMRELGATLHIGGRDFDDAKTRAKQYCHAHGAWMIEDGLDVAVSEGAGTIAVELLAAARARFDAVLIPLGNGALLNGMARWIKATSPGTRVIGVCAAGAPSMANSWRQGRAIDETSVNTIADGVAVRHPIPEAIADMLPLVDDVLLVEDDRIVDAMRLAHRHVGVVLEPSGALSIAALLNDPAMFGGQRVATVLCGGNLTEADIRAYLT